MIFCQILGRFCILLFWALIPLSCRELHMWKYSMQSGDITGNSCFILTFNTFWIKLVCNMINVTRVGFFIFKRIKTKIYYFSKYV
jgi:hypothetical protein